MGKQVSVVSTLESKPAMISDELRRQADEFVELADLQQIIARSLDRKPSPGRTHLSND
jgi:uncharacterized LabA/DUF88 family protein